MAVEKIKLPIIHQKVEPTILTDLFANEPDRTADKRDIRVFRDLAKKIKELSLDTKNDRRIQLWEVHNSLKRTRPLVLCYPENAYGEIIPYHSDSILKIKDPFLRQYEWYLRSQIFHWEELCDDWIISSKLKVPAVFNITTWGVEEIWDNPADPAGAARFTPIIKKERDLEKLEFPKLIYYKEETIRNLEYIQDIAGDILEPYIYFGIIPMFMGLGIGFFSRLRGLDQILIDMIDRPKWVHKAMEFFTEGTLKLIKDAEGRQLLGLNTADDYVGTGGMGYTNDLPQKDFSNRVRLKDIWGFGEAQELTGVSPTMLEEFVLSYQKKVLKNYGLNYYGCCEDLTTKFEVIKKNIPNLRRVSVAPWTNMEIASEALGDEYVYVWKPNPADLAVDDFDEDLIRRKIKTGYDITKENIVEIIMKDTHTLRGDPGRIKKWAGIAKELAMEY